MTNRAKYDRVSHPIVRGPAIHRPNPWPQKRIARFRQLWAAGETCSAIATALNTDGGTKLTASAVSGKRERLGLPPRGTPIKPPAPKKHPKPRPPRILKSKPLPPEPVTVRPLLIRTADLTPHTCRFPIGDPRLISFGFCGQPTDRTYCDHHHALAHQKPAAE